MPGAAWNRRLGGTHLSNEKRSPSDDVIADDPRASLAARSQSLIAMSALGWGFFSGRALVTRDFLFSGLTGAADGMLRGKPALRDYFAGGLRAYPALKFELLQILRGVQGFTLMYRSVDGLLAAETMTFGAGDKIVRAEVYYSEADSKAEREKPMEWRRDGYLLTDDPQCKDFAAICSLLQTTYWADDRSREMIEKSLRHSECLHLLHEGRQVGMIRGVTDQATFTWVCDVIVHPEHRGKGLGKWLVQCFLEHPRLKTISHHLCTKDAHGLYEEFGFQRIEAMRRSDRPMPFLLKA